MCKRLKSRVAFGKPVVEQSIWHERIAESRIMIEQARLLTLKAAHMMDTVGNKVAKAEIAMIKVLAPNMAQQIMDWAIQAYGGGGLSQDSPLASMFSPQPYSSSCRWTGRGSPPNYCQIRAFKAIYGRKKDTQDNKTYL